MTQFSASQELRIVQRECRRLVGAFLKRNDLGKPELDALAEELNALAAEATSAVRFLRMEREWS